MTARTLGKSDSTRGPRRLVACSLVGCAVLAATGCQSSRRVGGIDRYDRGIVFVLPGIEGRSVLNRNIANGLDEGGVSSAIEIHDWTVGLPGGFVFNLTNLERNQREARKLADRIVEYSRRHPGRPVHLIGHSGGGGIAVLALEALPPGERVDAAILLAPALSPTYDLSTALRRTRFGISNFYSARDVALLKFGTTLFGPIDRNHGASAGAVGFEPPAHLNGPDRELYDAELRQVRWSPRLKEVGASGGHFGWASREFARDYLAPLIKQHEASRPLPASLFE